jgi:hypothetical protein
VPTHPSHLSPPLCSIPEGTALAHGVSCHPTAHSRIQSTFTEYLGVTVVLSDEANQSTNVHNDFGY